jgi:hypothetical protein
MLERSRADFCYDFYRRERLPRGRVRAHTHIVGPCPMRGGADTDIKGVDKSVTKNANMRTGSRAPDRSWTHLFCDMERPAMAMGGALLSHLLKR